MLPGLGIGIAISEFAGQMADAVLVAMAAGTFIYVGATEVIAEEFENSLDKWKKFFALSGEHSVAFKCRRTLTLKHRNCIPLPSSHAARIRRGALAESCSLFDRCWQGDFSPNDSLRFVCKGMAGKWSC